MISDIALRLAGWRAPLYFGDPPMAERWAWLSKRVPPRAAPGGFRALDAGSGSGALTAYLAKYGGDAVGLSDDDDANRKAAHRAELLGVNAHFQTADLRELSQMEDLGQFDTIICFEVIEHVVEDGKLMADLADRLDSGGRLFLTTPHADYRGLLGDSEDHRVGGHVRWGYHESELRELAEAAGLTVERFDLVSGWWSQKLTNGMRRVSRVDTHLGWALLFPGRALLPLDKRMTARRSYPYLSLAMVARK